MRCACLAVICAVGVSLVALPVRAQWGVIAAEGDTQSRAQPSSGAAARAFDEFRRVRGLVSSLKVELEHYHRSPRVEDVRRDTLAREIESIMSDPPPDATQGLEKVRKISQDGLEDLKRIEEAPGSGNSDWSEEFEPLMEIDR